MNQSKRRKKYGNGSGMPVTNYIENPYEVLQEDKIDKAQAVYKAESNPITQIMDMIGKGLMSYGKEMGGTGSNAADAGIMAVGSMDFGNGGPVNQYQWDSNHPAPLDSNAFPPMYIGATPLAPLSDKDIAAQGFGVDNPMAKQFFTSNTDNTFKQDASQSYEKDYSKNSDLMEALNAEILNLRYPKKGNGGNIPGPGDPPKKTLIGKDAIDIPEGYAESYKNNTGQELPEDAYLTQMMLDEYNETGKAHTFEQYVPEPPPQQRFRQIPIDDGRGGTGFVYVPPTDEYKAYGKDKPMTETDWKQSEYYKTNRYQPETLYGGKTETNFKLGNFPFQKEPLLDTPAEKMQYDAGGGDLWKNRWLMQQQEQGNFVTPKKGNGGIADEVPVNIEGNEVVETPDGQLFDVNGPSHDNGGIDTTLPVGSKVYSNRIEIAGKTMEERKKVRERKQKTLEDLMYGNASDVLLKSAMNRVTKTNADQDSQDMLLQQVVDTLMGGEPVKKAWGGTVNSYANGTPPEGVPSPEEWAAIWTENQPNVPPTMEMYNQLILGGDPNAVGSLPTKSAQTIPTGVNNELIPPSVQSTNIYGTNPGSADEKNGGKFPNATAGDMTSIAGNLVSSIGPYLNTLKNRAMDTPNINAFKDFGIEGLQKLEEAQSYIEGVRANKLRDAELGKNAAFKRNRGSARGINTLRALDLATEEQAQKGQRDIYDSFATQTMGILGQQAQGEFVQDRTVMTGEAQRDIYDRMDSDNFATNMAQNIVGMGAGLQETGKDINAIKEREVMMNLINQLSSYGIQVDDQGNVIQGQ